MAAATDTLQETEDIYIEDDEVQVGRLFDCANYYTLCLFCLS